MRGIYNIIDFETTGLSCDYDFIIEVGILKIQDGKIVDQFESFINPGVRIPSMVTGLTGITNQMVSNAPSSSVVMAKMGAFVGSEPMLAHNASFDSRFFRAEMSRAGQYNENQFLCTLLLSRRIFQQLSSYKLGSLCDYLGITNRASHRAVGDAEVTLQLYTALCMTLEKKLSDATQSAYSTGLDLEFLQKLSKVPKKKVDTWLTQWVAKQIH